MLCIYLLLSPSLLLKHWKQKLGIFNSFIHSFIFKNPFPYNPVVCWRINCAHFHVDDSKSAYATNQGFSLFFFFFFLDIQLMHNPSQTIRKPWSSSLTITVNAVTGLSVTLVELVSWEPQMSATHMTSHKICRDKHSLASTSLILCRPCMVNGTARNHRNQWCRLCVQEYTLVLVQMSTNMTH